MFHVSDFVVQLVPEELPSSFRSRASLPLLDEPKAGLPVPCTGTEPSSIDTLLLLDDLELTRDSLLVEDGEEKKEYDRPINYSIMRRTHGTGRPFVDPYKVLQVRRDATPSEIRHAYKRLALWHHPDRRALDLSEQERDRRRQVFQILAACYETLVDKEAKSRCDVLLKEADVPDERSRPFRSTRSAGGRLIRRLSGTVSDVSNMPSLSPASSESDCGESAPIETTQQSSPLRHPSIDRRLSLCKTHSWSSGSVRRRRQRTKKRTENDAIGAFFMCSPPSVSHALQEEEDEDDIDTDDEEEIESEEQQRGSGIPTITRSASTRSTQDAEQHYSEHETNRLFGGPLRLLFRARRWKPFTDPYIIFTHVFGSQAWKHVVSPRDRPSTLSHWDQQTTSHLRATPPKKRSSTWAGSSERQSDGSVVFKTTRALHNRILIRTETVRTDPETGQRQSHVTVTSETLSEADSMHDSDETSSRQGQDPGFCDCRESLCFHYGRDDDNEHSGREPKSPPWSLCGPFLP